MNIAIVGSTEVHLAKALEVIAETFETLNVANTQILLRHPTNGAANPFEHGVAQLAMKYDYGVIWCYPDRRGGRAGVYVRDVHMAHMADMVLAFFAPNKLMLGGTGHVVEKAVDKDIPVQAYEIDEEGLRWVGSV